MLVFNGFTGYCIRDFFCEYGSIAQLVERWSPKPKVIGSSPIAPAVCWYDV